MRIDDVGGRAALVAQVAAKVEAGGSTFSVVDGSGFVRCGDSTLERVTEPADFARMRQLVAVALGPTVADELAVEGEWALLEALNDALLSQYGLAWDSIEWRVVHRALVAV